MKRGYSPKINCKNGHVMAETRRIGPDGKSYCSACASEYSRVYQRTYKRKSVQKNKHESARRSRLRCKYGISVDQLEDMLRRQDGVCAICRSGEWGPRGPQVDHDHVRGSIRGVLCFPCNIGLGWFRDKADRLENASLYLKQFSE